MKEWGALKILHFTFCTAYWAEGYLWIIFAHTHLSENVGVVSKTQDQNGVQTKIYFIEKGSFIYFNQNCKLGLGGLTTAAMF